MKLFSTEEALRAIVALRVNTDFHVFMRELGAWAEDRNKMLVFTNDPDMLPILQGSVRTLSELLEAVADAPNHLNLLLDRGRK